MTTSSNPSRIGVDIGGTFTDLVLVDEATGAVRVGKLLTTPKDPSQAVEEGVVTLLHEAGAAATAVRALIHGTTLVTNALIERKGARTGLLTTAGFRDAVEIGREGRYDMYDLFIEPPVPLVPRQLRLEVAERVQADGIDPAARSTRHRRAPRWPSSCALGVEAVAVCLLHAYRNPAHERALAGLCAELAPGVPVSCSSDVVPEIREYERTSTTIANVYVMPLMSRYLDDLERKLQGLGIPGRLYVMLSAGGIATAETAKRVPIRLVESGPAAGALAAARMAPPGRHGPRAVLRHGRHHRQGLRHRPRRAAAGARVRGRARGPLQEGLRPADPRAGDRDDRDRRGRRLHRPRRPHGAAQGRPGQRGRRSGPGLLRAAAAASRPSPMPTWCSAISTPSFFLGGPHAARRRGGPPRDRGARRATDGPRAHRRGLGHPPRRQREHGRRPRACTPSSAARTCAAIPCSPSAARGRCTPGRSGASCACRACSCRSGRGRSRPMGSWPRRSPSTSCAPRRSAWPRRTGRRSTASSTRWRRKAAAILRGAGVADRGRHRAPHRRDALLRPGPRGGRGDPGRPARPRQPRRDHRLVRGRLPRCSTAAPRRACRWRRSTGVASSPVRARSSRSPAGWRGRTGGAGAGSQETPSGLLPGSAGVRRDSRVRPLRARPRRASRRAGHRRGARVDHRHRPGARRSGWTSTGR